MNHKLQSILDELYEIDPKLKNHEIQLQKILNKLLQEKREVHINQKFQNELRSKLLKEEKNKILPFYKRPISRILLAALVSAAALTVVILPMYRGSLGQVESASEMKMVKSYDGLSQTAPMPDMEREAFGELSMRSSESESLEFNTEEYDRIYENDFLTALENPLSTFSIDVDTASYANIRRFLHNGSLPYADAVRIEEMINYFNYDYAAPRDETPFSINTELSTAPWNSENLLLKVGIQGQKISFEDLPPSNLVFLMDVSGSMNDPNKLPLLKNALKLVVNNMRDEDHISIVVYAGAAGTVLEPTSGREREKILEALTRLEAGGATAGAEGIKLAYEKAQENFNPQGNNRIILATDGDFNVGMSSDSAMVRLIEKKRNKGVYLTVLGFGMGNYKDSKIEQIADKGNGNYAYIDSILEARKVLVEEMGGTFFTIAKDVKIQIEFNPALVESYRLIGYENRLLANEDFDDDSKDAGELGAGHSVTALYELVLSAESNETNDLKYQSTTVNEDALNSGELMTIKIRYKDPDSSVSKLIETTVDNKVIDLDETSIDFRFAASVAQWGMMLRDSEHMGNTSFGKIITQALSSRGEDLQGYRREFIDLVKLSRDLQDY